MSIDLNKAAFRRLVQLYLLLLLLSVPLVILQVLSPTYETFDIEFQELVARHYGYAGYSEPLLVVMGAFLLAHFASAVSLLWFKRWGRLLFWFSIIVMLTLDSILGAPAEWYTRWTAWSEVVGSALFGVIVLLSYATGLGTVWFQPSAANERID